MRGDGRSCRWEVRSRLGGLGGESCGGARAPRLESGEESVFGRGDGERRMGLFGAGWWAEKGRVGGLMRIDHGRIVHRFSRSFFRPSLTAGLLRQSRARAIQPCILAGPPPRRLLYYKHEACLKCTADKADDSATRNHLSIKSRLLIRYDVRWSSDSWDSSISNSISCRKPAYARSPLILQGIVENSKPSLL
jgi:hypothetical protein